MFRMLVYRVKQMKMNKNWFRLLTCTRIEVRLRTASSFSACYTIWALAVRRMLWTLIYTVDFFRCSIILAFSYKEIRTNYKQKEIIYIMPIILLVYLFHQVTNKKIVGPYMCGLLTVNSHNLLYHLRTLLSDHPDIYMVEEVLAFLVVKLVYY